MKTEGQEQSAAATTTAVPRQLDRPEDAKVAWICIDYVQQSDEKNMAMAERIMKNLFKP